MWLNIFKRFNSMQKIIYIILFSLVVGGAQAQEQPERSLIRKGNRAFEKENYESSLERYEEAQKVAPTSFEAGYNMSNALYKMERYEKAGENLKKIIQDTLQVDSVRAHAHYNLGNTEFQQEKYQEALESYKQSMRLNPSDMEAKYNYAYTKKLIEDNQDEDKDDKDQDQDKDKDKQDQDKDKGDQDQDQKDKGDQDKQDGQDDGEQDEKEGDGGAQPQESGISPQEQEQMLEAIQAQEDKTQDKLKDKQGVVVSGGKNW